MVRTKLDESEDLFEVRRCEFTTYILFGKILGMLIRERTENSSFILEYFNGILASFLVENYLILQILSFVISLKLKN